MQIYIFSVLLILASQRIEDVIGKDIKIYWKNNAEKKLNQNQIIGQLFLGDDIMQQEQYKVFIIVNFF